MMSPKQPVLNLLMLAGGIALYIWLNHQFDGPSKATFPPNAYDLTRTTLEASGDSHQAIQDKSISISPKQMQQLGVRVVTVGASQQSRSFSFLGRVATDETRIYRINSGIDGVIHETFGFRVGSKVKKNTTLITIVAPATIPAVQLFILNSQAMDRAKMSPAEGQNAVELATANIRQRLDQLESFGLSKEQIKEIAEKQEFPQAIRIVSPADGVILTSNTSPGLTFDKGHEFFQIADLNKIWVEADVFEGDLLLFRRGASSQLFVQTPAGPLPAHLDDTLPRFDAKSRSFKVRLIVNNSKLELVPGQAVEIAVRTSPPEGFVIPVDALIDSGFKKTLYVESAPGRFVPRDVSIEWQDNKLIEVTKGLRAGDKVVVSSPFVLYSESLLNTQENRLNPQHQQASGDPKTHSQSTENVHIHNHP